ncbi:MAG: DUF1552 domain-containing protein, partial [Myxococcota bacterium]
MGKGTLSRRMVLRGALGAGAISVGVPYLDAMFDDHGTAFADGAAVPNRYGVWWWGNGIRREHWVPDREGPGFDLKAETEPFAGVREYMTLLTGFDLPSNENVHNTGHAWMTAGHSDHSKRYHTPGDQAYSSDQIVADAWDGQTPVHSLQLGVSRMGYEGNQTTGNTSYDSRANALRAEFNPKMVFDRIFAGVQPGMMDDAMAAEMRRLRRRRASVLDAVLESSRSLEARVGARDRARLDQHFTALRSLEESLSVETQGGPAVGCAPTPVAAEGTEPGQHNAREPLEETHDA